MLRSRLTLGLLPLLLLFLAVCLYAYRASRDLGNAVEDMLARNVASVARLEQMQAAAERMNDGMAAARAGTAGGRARFEAARSTFKSGLNDELLNHPSAIAGGILNDLYARFDRFARAGEVTVQGGRFAPLETYERAAGAFLAVNEGLGRALERDHTEIGLATARVRARTASTLRLLLFAMLAAVLLFFFLSWSLAGRLLQPIKAVTASALALGDGELDHEVPVTSRDELGQLARTFNTLAARLRAYREAMASRVLRTQRTMEATLASAPDPLFVVSADGAPTLRNPAAEQLAGAPAFPADFPPAVAGPLARVLATGEHHLPTDYAGAITLRVGREDRHYLPRILAIGDSLTEFKGAAVILQDVTKFRLLDDAKTNLVGTVSHELKTPLTSLRMAVYLLLEPDFGELAARQRELLETARDEADRLLRILDNLLDLARLEGGASSLERRPVSVGALLDEVAREAGALAEAAGRRLAVEADPAVRERELNVDRERLRHVFLNLLTNASKYSPPNGRITLAAADGPGAFVRFAVRDAGPGLPPADAARVFDRFFRAAGQTATGAGLGLAIAREIVVAHGGSIACASEPGRTEFYFLIPR